MQGTETRTESMKVAFYVVWNGDGTRGLPCDLAFVSRANGGADADSWSEMRQRIALLSMRHSLK